MEAATRQRAKSICRHVNCSTLVDTPGYCKQHQVKDRFAKLKRNSRTPKGFYWGAPWKKARAAYKRSQPLCERCLSKGLVSEARVIDHHPYEVSELIAKGLSPYSFKYLRSLCIPCDKSKLALYQNRNK